MKSHFIYHIYQKREGKRFWDFIQYDGMTLDIKYGIYVVNVDPFPSEELNIHCLSSGMSL